MSTVRRWLRRLTTTFGSGRAERELNREVASHFALIEDDFRRRGLSAVPETTVEELKARMDSNANFYLLDVREPHEYQIARIPGATLIPLGQLGARSGELPPASSGTEIVIHCKSGVRSARAVSLLKEHGIEAKNLKGGILAWIDRIDPTQPRY